MIQASTSGAEDLIGVVSRPSVRASRALALELGRRPDDERENGEAVDARIACDQLAAGAGPGEECVLGDEILGKRIDGRWLRDFASRC